MTELIIDTTEIHDMQLDTILIKVVSTCNLNCSYCYIYNSSDTSIKEQVSSMSNDTILSVCDSLFQQSKEQDAGFAIVLHGGEPLMLGLQKMTLLLTTLRNNLNESKFPISIQTNGVLLNSEYIDLFSKTTTSVSISIDGIKEVNDISRLDHSGKSTFENVLNGIRMLQSHADSSFLFTGTLSVIQINSNPEELYNFFKKLSIPSANFLLQDGNYDLLPKGKESFETTEYGSWIYRLIEIYLSDESPIVIPFIDDLIKVALGDSSEKEGIGENTYGILIIETDGEIRKNDTLRTSFDGADFFQKRPNIQETSLSSILSSIEFHDTCSMQVNLADDCKDCQLLDVCGGGMPLYRWKTDNRYDNPSVYCNDHKLYINLIKNILENTYE
jgi:uncharacterized protein